MKFNQKYKQNEHCISPKGIVCARNCYFAFVANILISRKVASREASLISLKYLKCRIAQYVYDVAVDLICMEMDSTPLDAAGAGSQI